MSLVRSTPASHAATGRRAFRVPHVVGFGTVFGIDLRTLALFRASLGTYLLLDLALRARDLGAHYTDAGVLPRWVQLDFLSSGSTSLHLANGSLAFQGALFFVAGLAALMLVLGWRTRLATVASWALLVSLQNRNTFILSGEDNLAAVMLFWAMFLPLGARWSVDAALNRAPAGDTPNRFASVATGAILVQGMSMYLFSALLKSDAMWGWEGTAVYYALQLDYFATPFAHWLRGFEGLMRLATWSVWTLELLGPVLIFSPLFHRALRLGLMLAFISMHLAFALCLEIGLFPFISIVMNLLFLPGWVWDRLDSALRPRGPVLAVWYDRDCGFCLRMCRLLATFLVLPRVRIAPAQDHPVAGPILEAQNSWVVGPCSPAPGEALHTGWEALCQLVAASPIAFPLARPMGWPPLAMAGNRAYRAIARNRATLGRVSARLLPWHERRIGTGRLSDGLAAFFLVFVTVQNLSTLPALSMELPNTFRTVRQALGLYQNWTMFAPYPEMTSPWPLIEGRTLAGRPVDVYAGLDESPDEAKPAYVSRIYANGRWRKFLSNVEDASYGAGEQPLSLAYGRYLCRRWDGVHAGDDRLATFEIAFFAERTGAPGRPKTLERRTIWWHDCRG